MTSPTVRRSHADAGAIRIGGQRLGEAGQIRNARKRVSIDDEQDETRGRKRDHNQSRRCFRENTHDELEGETARSESSCRMCMAADRVGAPGTGHRAPAGQIAK
jgi:hypothetical protein